MANVFGALNRFIARLDSDPNSISQSKSTPSHAASSNAYGFQVLKNTSVDLPLEPWFDFVVGVNGRMIDNSDGNLLATELRNCAGTAISLGVYGAKGQAVREIYANIPSDDGAANLGLSLQWAPIAGTDHVWHILDVMPNSPADVAGLLPYSDYVIGSPERAGLRGEAALGELVEEFLDRSLRLHVYNHEYDVTRSITITPARNWGGNGVLGCVLGYGALHRVPAPLTEPSQGPGETLFESSDDFSYAQQLVSGDGGAPFGADSDKAASGGGAFLVPADMQMPSTSPPSGPSPPPQGAGPGAAVPPSGKARKQRAHAVAPAAGLDDYFAEGEQKSRELDKGSTPKPSGSLPPPPKGGPPKASDG